MSIDDRVLPPRRRMADDHAARPPLYDTSTVAWPPRTRGPLPPQDSLPPDLNIGTAQDEADAWAHEHDWVTTELSRVRVLLSGDPDDPDYQSLESRLVLERAKARRTARANPAERGRRTAGDIDTEVEEALEISGIAGQVRAVQAYQETLMGRLFRAKDNLNRLQNYVRSLPLVGEHRP